MASLPSANSKMYFYQQWSNNLGDGLSTVSTSNGTVTTVVKGAYQPYRPDIAADDGGNLYAIDRNFGATNLYTVSKTTGNTSLIGSNLAGINTIAFSSDAANVPEPATLPARIRERTRSSLAAS